MSRSKGWLVTAGNELFYTTDPTETRNKYREFEQQGWLYISLESSDGPEHKPESKKLERNGI